MVMNEETGTSAKGEMYWHSLSSEEVVLALETDAEEGLKDVEVSQRKKIYGLNELKEAPP